MNQSHIFRHSLSDILADATGLVCEHPFSIIGITIRYGMIETTRFYNLFVVSIQLDT